MPTSDVKSPQICVQGMAEQKKKEKKNIYLLELREALYLGILYRSVIVFSLHWLSCHNCLIPEYVRIDYVRMFQSNHIDYVSEILVVKYSYPVTWHV